MVAAISRELERFLLELGTYFLFHRSPEAHGPSEQQIACAFCRPSWCSSLAFSIFSSMYFARLSLTSSIFLAAEHLSAPTSSAAISNLDYALFFESFNNV
jgi:hypothetical protein